MQTLRIQSRNGPYDVHFDHSLPSAVAASNAEGRSWLLVDSTLADLHGQTLAAHFPGERLLAIPAVEDHKSFERTARIFTWLLSSGFRRDSILVALGGGIIQDIAAFVATVIMRGAAWRLIPSTLLAQCDSCIGAKSSINIDRFKNQLGSFHAPTDIYVIPDLLRTLPSQAMRSGFGEIVKFHLLDGEESWRSIQNQMHWDDLSHLTRLIHTSLRIKQRYIEVDEFDRGVRNLLNYGHTFGHAFESATDFAIPHGLAVALGMSTATYISEQLEMVDPGHYQQVEKVLRPLYPDCIGHLKSASIDRIVAAMGTDKKNIGGATYVILTRGPGKMEKTKVDLHQQIRPLLSTFIDHL